MRTGGGGGDCKQSEDEFSTLKKFTFRTNDFITSVITNVRVEDSRYALVIYGSIPCTELSESERAMQFSGNFAAPCRFLAVVVRAMTLDATCRKIWYLS